MPATRCGSTLSCCLTSEDLDYPAGSIGRVIGGDTSGIDEVIAEFERDVEVGPANVLTALWTAESTCMTGVAQCRDGAAHAVAVCADPALPVLLSQTARCRWAGVRAAPCSSGRRAA